MDSTIEIDGHRFDEATSYFVFEGAHEIVDPSELAKLRSFTRLTGASFGGTQLDDAGLAHVCAVATIENLNLQYTRVSDDGLAHLAGLPRLSYLRLKENHQLTNGCVRHLLRLTSLVELQVHETSIDERGLAELVPLTNLQDIWIDIWNGNYTFSGLEELSRRMPRCTILAKGHGEFRDGEFAGKWRA